jgi:hypothetical protein
MPPHCDTMDGPVVTAAPRALAESDAALVLPYVPREGEDVSHLGAQLAGMVLHGEPGPAALMTRRRIPMPPEPIRWLVAKGIMRGLAALDRRTDSRAQPRAGKEPAALEEAEREPAETV